MAAIILVVKASFHSLSFDLLSSDNDLTWTGRFFLRHGLRLGL